MKVGVHVVSFAWPQAPESIPTILGAIAEKVEEIGCHSLSVMDHYFQMEDFFPVDEEMLEGYTTLGFLAARTQRIQLRILVTGVTYREPGLLAKIVTTLDVMSGGRGELSIGAAWYEREHRGLGVAFPRPAERFERLEEALQICLQMWSEDNDNLGLDFREYPAEKVRVISTMSWPEGARHWFPAYDHPNDRATEEVAGDDTIHEAAPVPILFLEALLPQSFHILVVPLEELVERSGSDMAGVVETRRVFPAPTCRLPLSSGWWPGKDNADWPIG